MGAFQILTPLFQLVLDYEKEIPAFPQRHVVCFVLKNHKVTGGPVAVCICTFTQNPDLKKTEQIFNTANKYLNS